MKWCKFSITKLPPFSLHRKHKSDRLGKKPDNPPHTPSSPHFYGNEMPITQHPYLHSSLYTGYKPIISHSRGPATVYTDKIAAKDENFIRLQLHNLIWCKFSLVNSKTSIIIVTANPRSKLLFPQIFSRYGIFCRNIQW